MSNVKANAENPKRDKYTWLVEVYRKEEKSRLVYEPRPSWFDSSVN